METETPMGACQQYLFKTPYREDLSQPASSAADLLC